MKLSIVAVGSLMALSGSVFAQSTQGPSRSADLSYQNMGPLSGYTSLASQLPYGQRTYGDTFNIQLLAQNATNAYFITSTGGNGTPYNGTTFSNGDLATYNPSAGHGAASFGFESVGADTTVQVGVFSSTTPQFDMLPAGVDPGTGPLTQIRMDMGQTAAAGNALSPYPLFNIISAQVVLFSGTTAIFASNLGAGNGSFAGQTNQTALSDVAVIGGAAGANITEMDFIYHITAVPAPSALGLLGLGGLIAGRRRR